MKEQESVFDETKRIYVRDAHLKPWDCVIILVLILSSFLPLFYFWPDTNGGQRSRLTGRWDRKSNVWLSLKVRKDAYTYLYEDEDGDTNYWRSKAIGSESRKLIAATRFVSAVAGPVKMGKPSSVCLINWWSKSSRRWEWDRRSNLLIVCLWVRLQRIIFISLLVAQGVVIGLVENMIPYPFAFAPGAKLGFGKFNYHYCFVHHAEKRQLSLDLAKTDFKRRY